LIASAVTQLCSACLLIRGIGLLAGSLFRVWAQPLFVTAMALGITGWLAARHDPVATVGSVVLSGIVYLGCFVAGLMLTDRWLPIELRQNLRWMVHTMLRPQQTATAP
jgi:hypothetical protein